jgi:Y_Y_Y domain
MANHPGRIGHWFGGEFGLARLDGERFYSVRSVPELPLDGITGIVETTDGDLWLNGRAGIVHIAAAELERSRADPAYRVRGETLGAFDGVVGSSAILRPLPTAIEAADGKLWFATTSGIYGIDPARRVHNRVPPPVLIRALSVAGHTIEPIPGLTLPTYTTAVRFDYVGLSLTAPEKVRYRYRLDGVDTDWCEPTAARQTLRTNLRPGHYAFRVIAANNDGVWNESGASLAFVIPPAFVQTDGSSPCAWQLVRPPCGLWSACGSARYAGGSRSAWKSVSTSGIGSPGSCTIPCCKVFKDCCSASKRLTRYSIRARPTPRRSLGARLIRRRRPLPRVATPSRTCAPRLLMTVISRLH